MNLLVINGHLVRDPEIKTTASGISICTFDIAYNHNKEDVSFFKVQCWEKTADNVKKYMKKGSKVLCTCDIRQNRWKDAEGKTHSVIILNAFHVEFEGSKKEGEADGGKHSTESPGKD